jgi:hypothetical protein
MNVVDMKQTTKVIGESHYLRQNNKVSYMTRLLKLNEINSNWIFLFPVISGLLKNHPLYSFLSLCIFVASFCFHIYKYGYSNGAYIKHLRGLDISVATVCYLYMFYFVKTFLTHNQFYFYILIISTIALFFFGKTKLGLRYNVHSYFHVAIGIVAGIIPLFA